MARYRDLIDIEANLAQIEDFQEHRQVDNDRFETESQNENLQRSRAVSDWLRATNVDVDQDAFCKIRAEYSGTGRWLLEKGAFREWFNPKFPAIPPLLWLSGIPGAGEFLFWITRWNIA